MHLAESAIFPPKCISFYVSDKEKLHHVQLSSKQLEHGQAGMIGETFIIVSSNATDKKLWFSSIQCNSKAGTPPVFIHQKEEKLTLLLTYVFNMNHMLNVWYLTALHCNNGDSYKEPSQYTASEAWDAVWMAITQTRQKLPNVKGTNDLS